MLDCIDSFKTGDCGCGGCKCGCGGSKDCGGGGGCGNCGCAPCQCSPPTHEHEHGVSSSIGGCTPVLRDPFHIVSHSCRKGPDMTIRAPAYVLTVLNPPDSIARNPDGSPMLDISGNVVAKTA